MNIFSYESKVSQILLFMADLAILNIVFVICCLPVFTIGAAQAALYSAIRAHLDPEDDESLVKVFFRAFRTGFGPITGAWLIFFALEFLMTAILYGMLAIPGFPTWTAIVSLIVLMLFHAQIPMFHSRFNCSAAQLIRNSFFLVLAHPLRSILTAVLLWLPFVVLLWDIPIFAAALPSWILIYYSIAFMLNFTVMKKPFKELIDHYNKTHDQEGNVILATVDEDGELVYENSIQDALDAQAEPEKEEEE